MREKVYRLLESAGYSAFMVICILVSLIPLLFHTQIPAFTAIDYATAAAFLFDYLARWLTADLAAPSRKMPFALYPMQPMAVIDLLSILPTVTVLSSTLKLLKLFRLARMLRMFRIFRAFRLARYSRSIRMIAAVFRAQKEALLTVLTLAICYILISALVVFNVEPDTFTDFFEAIYWATVSLTTMGYGDIYPVTAVGRVVTILSSLFGIAIVALPAGIVTAGYMEELEKGRDTNGETQKNTALETAETVNEDDTHSRPLHRGVD